MSPDAALEAALELCDVLPEGAGRVDAVRTREIEEARAAWRTLRARMACRPANPARR